MERKKRSAKIPLIRGYSPMEQKNMLNSYGYLYDALNGDDQVVTSSNFIGILRKRSIMLKTRDIVKSYQTKKFSDGIPIGWEMHGKTIRLSCCPLYPIFLIKSIRQVVPIRIRSKFWSGEIPH